MTDKDPLGADQDEEVTTEEVETVTIDAQDSPQEQLPTFSGEQVAYLLRNFTPGAGNAAAPPQGQAQPVQATAPLKAKGAYDSKFGVMHLILDSDIMRMNALGVVLIMAGVFYWTGGFGYFEFGRIESLVFWQPVLMVGIGLLFLIRSVIQWKRSHLYTSQDHVVYEVKSFIPLFIMPKKIQARLPKIDSNVFGQNFVEVLFRLDSGTLMLDTAAQTADQGLHKLRGVKKVDELMRDIGAS